MTATFKNKGLPPAVLFDCDGVLADTMRANYESYRRALVEVGPDGMADDFTEALYQSYYGLSFDRWLPQLAGAATRAVRQRKAELYFECLAEYGLLLPGMATLLQLTGHGFPVAVVTNASAKSMEQMKAWIASVGLSMPEIVPVFTSGKTIAPKPHPDLLIEALRLLRAERAVLVDDNVESGREAAAGAGIDFIAAEEGAANVPYAVRDWLKAVGAGLPQPLTFKGAVGVILAAGTGARLAPKVVAFHKPLVEVMGRPVVAWAASSLAPHVAELIVVVHPASMVEVVDAVSNAAAEYSVPVRSVSQHTPKGVAHDLMMAANAIAEERPLIMVCGDNIIAGSDVKAAAVRLQEAKGCGLAWTFRRAGANEARRLAVLGTDGAGRECLVEKPEQPQSDICWCGPLAFASTSDLRRRIALLSYSARGELEITDLMNSYIREGRATALPLQGPWFDVGTPESLKAARLAICGDNLLR